MRRHALNGLWVMTGKVLAILAGMLGNVILTRLMSPDEVGIYFLLISIASVATLLGQVGQNQAVMRFIAGLRGQGREDEIGGVVVKSLAIAAAGSLMLAASSYLFVNLAGPAVFHSPLVRVGSDWLAAWIVFSTLRALAAECLRGYEDIRLATLFEGLLTSVVFVLLLGSVWFTWHAATLDQVMLMTALAALVSMLAVLPVLWRRCTPLALPGPVAAGELLRSGLPLLGGNLVVVVMTSVGLWAVGYLGTPADAAQYGAATRLMMLAQFPLLALNAMIPPMIARMYAEQRIVEMEQAVRLAAAVSLLLSGGVMLLFMAWGGGVLSLLFGAYYAGAKWMLVLLCVGVVGNAWSGFCGPVLMMTGHHDALLRMSVWAAVVTLLATWELGKGFGAEGVALAMSIGMVVLHLLMWIAVRRHLGIWTHAGGLLSYARGLLATR